jgi:arylsulfatase A-like enzyme
VAERWSTRDVLLFGTPAAEPHQAEGFYREASLAEGDPYLWSRKEAEVSLSWPGVAPRAAVVELAPYKGVKGQAVEVALNGNRVAGFALNDNRHRYGFALPAEAQAAGENRLRFTFRDTGSPGEDPRNPDRRHLAAAFYSLTVGPASDPTLQDLLGRDAPAPFAATSTAGVPSLVQVGPSVVRYALRLPAGAELRFQPDLHPAARAAAASVSLRVTLETRAGQEQELWSRVVAPRDPAPREAVVSLPGATGDIVRLGLHVGGASDTRHAWSVWKAPRVMGRDAASDPLAPGGTAEDAKRGEGLRQALAGSNVLLVILDAARADRFGCYGYGKATTPEIDRIAAEGVVFERAFTPAVYTLGAMSSLWTSQYPDRHHGDVSFSARLPSDRLTLADVLSGQAIHTAGFVANTVAGGLNGFDRGFQEFHEVWRELGSRGDVFGKALPPFFEKNRDRRFFAYVHFREPHFPYDPEPPFDTRFGPEGPIPKAVRRDATWITDVNQGRRTLTAQETDHLRRLYDGNLAYADQQVGLLRRNLEAAGLWDRTVLIVAADHGEALLEHGWIGHNVQLFEESVHIPLIVRFPAGKGPAGKRVSGLTDLLDVAPTIADVFGVLGKGGSDRQFQGRSLLAVLDGAPGKTAVLSRTVWDRPVYALRDDRHKFVYHTRTGEARLYDLRQDPGESRDAAAGDPLRTAYSRQVLHHSIGRLARGAAGPGEGASLSCEQCQNLKAMGYLGSDFKCPCP